jgi:hypothetical protein
MQKKISPKGPFSVRQIIVVALLFMMTGTALELYLLDHYEDVQQLIPLLCIGAALLTMLVLLFRKSNFATQLFKGILGIAALSGLYGTFLHLQANYEFEQEMRPTAGDWDLLVESLSGALPALAPLSMVVLALLGYSYLKLLNEK